MLRLPGAGKRLRARFALRALRRFPAPGRLRIHSGWPTDFRSGQLFPDLGSAGQLTQIPSIWEIWKSDMFRLPTAGGENFAVLEPQECDF